MNYNLFLISFISLLFIASIILSSVIHRNIIVTPAVSISMSKYEYPYFDTKRSLILPGSLVICVSRTNNPLFKIYTQRPTIDPFSIASTIFLSLSIVFFVLFILFALIKNENILYPVVFIFLSIIFFSTSVLLNSHVYPNDIVCYEEEILNEKAIICHQYIGIKDNKLLLLRVYDNQTEEVDETKVVAKVVFTMPPPLGAFMIIYKAIVDISFSLYYIITQGSIPLGYKISYIEVV